MAVKISSSRDEYSWRKEADIYQTVYSTLVSCHGGTLSYFKLGLTTVIMILMHIVSITEIGFTVPISAFGIHSYLVYVKMANSCYL